MKLATTLLALLCLGALANADTTEQSTEPKVVNLQLPQLQLPKLPELKLPKLELPKLELPKLEAKQQLKMPGRLRMGQLNLALPNVTGIQAPTVRSHAEC